MLIIRHSGLPFGTPHETWALQVPIRERHVPPLVTPPKGGARLVPALGRWSGSPGWLVSDPIRGLDRVAVARGIGGLCDSTARWRSKVLANGACPPPRSALALSNSLTNEPRSRGRNPPPRSRQARSHRPLGAASRWLRPHPLRQHGAAPPPRASQGGAKPRPKMPTG